MGDFLTVIAAVEWIALGLIVFNKLRKWNRELQKLLGDLEKEINDEKHSL